MLQSEDKLALDALNKEIEIIADKISNLEIILAESMDKLDQLTARKKSIENYLNSDNN